MSSDLFFILILGNQHTIIIYYWSIWFIENQSISLISSKYFIFVISAFVVHGGTQTALLLWQPQQEPVYIIYIFAGLWGTGDAVIQAQINGA